MDKDVIYIYTMQYYSAFKKKKKNEILPFVTTWMDLGGIMLSEISQRKIPYDLTYMWNLKTKQTKQNENRPIDRTNRWRGMGRTGEGN